MSNKSYLAQLQEYRPRWSLSKRTTIAPAFARSVQEGKFGEGDLRAFVDQYEREALVQGQTTKSDMLSDLASFVGHRDPVSPVPDASGPVKISGRARVRAAPVEKEAPAEPVPQTEPPAPAEDDLAFLQVLKAEQAPAAPTSLTPEDQAAIKQMTKTGVVDSSLINRLFRRAQADVGKVKQTLVPEGLDAELMRSVMNTFSTDVMPQVAEVLRVLWRYLRIGSQEIVEIARPLMNEINEMVLRAAREGVDITQEQIIPFVREFVVDMIQQVLQIVVNVVVSAVVEAIRSAVFAGGLDDHRASGRAALPDMLDVHARFMSTFTNPEFRAIVEGGVGRDYDDGFVRVRAGDDVRPLAIAAHAFHSADAYMEPERFTRAFLHREVMQGVLERWKVGDSAEAQQAEAVDLNELLMREIRKRRADLGEEPEAPRGPTDDAEWDDLPSLPPQQALSVPPPVPPAGVPQAPPPPAPSATLTAMQRRALDDLQIPPAIRPADGVRPENAEASRRAELFVRPEAQQPAQARGVRAFAQAVPSMDAGDDSVLADQLARARAYQADLADYNALIRRFGGVPVGVGQNPALRSAVEQAVPVAPYATLVAQASAPSGGAVRVVDASLAAREQERLVRDITNAVLADLPAARDSEAAAAIVRQIAKSVAADAPAMFDQAARNLQAQPPAADEFDGLRGLDQAMPEAAAQAVRTTAVTTSWGRRGQQLSEFLAPLVRQAGQDTTAALADPGVQEALRQTSQSVASTGASAASTGASKGLSAFKKYQADKKAKKAGTPAAPPKDSKVAKSSKNSKDSKDAKSKTTDSKSSKTKKSRKSKKKSASAFTSDVRSGKRPILVGDDYSLAYAPYETRQELEMWPEGESMRDVPTYGVLYEPGSKFANRLQREAGQVDEGDEYSMGELTEATEYLVYDPMLDGLLEGRFKGSSSAGTYQVGPYRVHFEEGRGGADPLGELRRVRMEMRASPELRGQVYSTLGRVERRLHAEGLFDGIFSRGGKAAKPAAVIEDVYLQLERMPEDGVATYAKTLAVSVFRLFDAWTDEEYADRDKQAERLRVYGYLLRLCLAAVHALATYEVLDKPTVEGRYPILQDASDEFAKLMELVVGTMPRGDPIGRGLRAGGWLDQLKGKAGDTTQLDEIQGERKAEDTLESRLFGNIKEAVLRDAKERLADYAQLYAKGVRDAAASDATDTDNDGRTSVWSEANARRVRGMFLFWYYLAAAVLTVSDPSLRDATVKYFAQMLLQPVVLDRRQYLAVLDAANQTEGAPPPLAAAAQFDARERLDRHGRKVARRVQSMYRPDRQPARLQVATFLPANPILRRAVLQDERLLHAATAVRVGGGGPGAPWHFGPEGDAWIAEQEDEPPVVHVEGGLAEAILRPGTDGRLCVRKAFAVADEPAGFTHTTYIAQ